MASLFNRLADEMDPASAWSHHHDGHLGARKYVWTLFVKPFQAATGAALPTVQITFSVLIVLQTLFSPAQGWLVDRFGPKALVAVGAALSRPRMGYLGSASTMCGCCS